MGAFNSVILGLAIVASPVTIGEMPHGHDRAQIRKVVREVLSDPEISRASAEGESKESWLWGHVLRFFSWLDDLFVELPAWLAYILVIWMVLTLLAILAHLVYVVITQFGEGRASKPTAQGVKSGKLYGIQELEFNAVRAEATARLSAGDWPAAVRYLYVAAILWLDRIGHIHFRESKTNRDYMVELAPRPDVQGPFRDLTAGFEAIVYGDADATEQHCRGMASTFELLRGEDGAANEA